MENDGNARQMRFVETTLAAPEQAFALVADIERHGEWSPQEFEASRVGDGPIGVGATYRTAGRTGARKGVMRS